MSDVERTLIQQLVEHLDLEGLAGEVDKLDDDSRYSWKLERHHRELAQIHPSLSFLAEQIEAIDQLRTGEATGDAYRGAVLALLAFARISMEEDDDDDTIEEFIESAVNPSFAKVLHELTADGAEAVFTRAMHEVRIQARTSGAEPGAVIASGIQDGYPGVHDFITRLRGESKHSEEYKAGLAAGAAEMFLVIRELAGNEEIRLAAKEHPSE